MAEMKNTARLISLVIPLYNEEKSLKILVKKIFDVESQHKYLFEVIFVDDGSTDSSWTIIQSLVNKHRNLAGIRLRKNTGKSYALQAGFIMATGTVIITLDADLQDDPHEIPKLLDKIDVGFDVVSGWKKNRNDPITKTFPSRIYNRLARFLFKTSLHDINCGLKAYTSEVVDKLNLYGGVHRLIPLIALNHGFLVTEVPVKHHFRKHGKSKYGWSRFAKGALDLFSLYAKLTFFDRPMHFFGTTGFILLALGLVGSSYLSLLWALGQGPIGDRPLLLFSVLSIISGLQLISLGVLADLVSEQTSKRNIFDYVEKSTKQFSN